MRVSQVKVVSSDGTAEGTVQVVDLGTGLYEVTYMAPREGEFLVHVTCTDVAKPERPCVHIRGSPFLVNCESAWSSVATSGEAPAHRPVRFLPLCIFLENYIIHNRHHPGKNVVFFDC